ncbi:MAG TPA: hypothetical protein VN749_15215 [Candidatus Eisenbacteria bacterium]|jgi:hypothetical protein|nr:hypothetical protein [Candidatus Eisenbacteria bacterium]
MPVNDEKLLRVAAKELERLRQENARLRQEIVRLHIRRSERPGQDYATYPGRQLETTTKQQEGTAGKNE